MYRIRPPYTDINLKDRSSRVVYVDDHMGGFDSSLRCSVLDKISCTNSKNPISVATEYIFDAPVKQNYPDLDLKFDIGIWMEGNYVSTFEKYTQHPDKGIKNFICNFNGTAHHGRDLLTAALYRWGWFDENFSTKNTATSVDSIDGHLRILVGDRERIYRKFFVGEDSDTFLQKKISVNYDRFRHDNNLVVLEKALSGSFLYLVSESCSTSYVPFVTEKFLYGVLTRSLFLAYAQPGWHDHLEKYYGFRKFSIFDYRFDSIQNPVDRMLELLSMLTRFSMLGPMDWHDLYLVEHDTIEHNIDHFRSGGYLKKLQCYAS
jgi:hypothetical protein